MALDVGSALASAGFDHVRVEGALHQELNIAGFAHHLTSGGLEGANELPPDDLALCLGIGHAGQGGEELVRGVDYLEVDAGRRYVIPFHLLGLTLAEQAMIDEDAGQLVTHCSLNQGSSYSRVNPSGQSADQMLVANLLLDGQHGGLDDV